MCESDDLQIKKEIDDIMMRIEGIIDTIETLDPAKKNTADRDES